MRQLRTRFFLLLTTLFVLATSTTRAQDLTGIWRGYFSSSGADQYKFELQISHKKTAISGVSYSYLNTVFYGKATLTGNYNSNSQNILIQEIKTVELKMSSGSSACIMKCSFQYFRSGKEEFLEGTFTSKFEKDGYGSKKGEFCGGGKVYLRKVISSDFYIEPFLRKQLAAKSTEPEEKTETVSTPPAVRKTPTPAPKTNPPAKSNSTAKTNTNTTTKTTSSKPKTTTKNNTAKNTKPPVTKKPDSSPVTIIEDPIVKVEPEKSPSIKKPALPPPAVIKERENNLVKVLTVDAENIVVKIYDNGEIDDDTISVYLDNKLVLSKKRLTTSPLVVNLKMDEDNEVHELVMVADNLGRIPPNTSLMVVNAGDKKYDVRITSTEQKNAVVRFIYRKPD